MWITQEHYERLQERIRFAENKAAIAEAKSEQMQVQIQQMREQQNEWVRRMTGPAQAAANLQMPEPEWMKQVDWDRVSGRKEEV
jgi:hypothetical protein